MSNIPYINDSINGFILGSFGNALRVLVKRNGLEGNFIPLI